MNRCLAVTVAFSVWWAAGCSRPITSASVEEERPPVAVRAVIVQARPLRPTLELIGTLEAPPENTAVLSSQVAGYVERVFAVAGQSVRAGDVIAHLDTRLFEAELRKLAAAADECRARVALAEKGPQRQEIEAARQEVRSAEATRNARKAKLDALDALRATGDISAVQLELATTSLQEAEAQWNGAEERLNLLEAGTRPEVLAEEKAHLAVAESEYAAQQLNIKLCDILSPIDGVVAELPVRVGMSVEKSAVLATILDPRSLFASVRVPSAQVALVGDQAAASVTVDGLTDQALQGRVERISSQAEPNTGSMEVLIRVDNASGRLRPGVGCRVTVSLPEVVDALAVPDSALSEHDGGIVLTLVRDAAAHQVSVKTGVRTASEVQITEGIAPGDTVITAGGYALPEGCPVTVVTEGGEAAAAAEPGP